MSSINGKLYSYDTVIAQWYKGRLIGNNTKYSSTTSRHLSYIKKYVYYWTSNNVPIGSTDLVPYLNLKLFDINKMTLIIVDCQYDFIEGTMAVKGAKEAVDNIISFINKNKRDIKKVIFTTDWHPINHCSFKHMGGNWPIHCVNHTKGASIDYNLIKTVENYNIEYELIRKGTTKYIEEYGANFNKISIQDLMHCVVCGIAGDYCVAESIKNLVFAYPLVLLSGVVSIDDGSTIRKIIKKYRLKTIE